MKKFGILLSIAAVVAVIYLTGCVRNEPPVIESFATDPASDTLVTAGDTVNIICQTSDPDGDTLSISLDANAGTFLGTVTGGEVLWVAPGHSASAVLICTVKDSDTLNPVSDTLEITVQNYFPMALNNKWVYEGSLVYTTLTLEMTAYSKEELGNGQTRWHMERYFHSSDGLINSRDSLLYYTLAGDSIIVFDPAFDEEYLALLLPLWLNKAWAADGENATASIAEIKDRGTVAGNFVLCARVEFLNLGTGDDSRTVWLAPDVGIIETTLVFGQATVKLELVSYEVN